MTSSRMGNVSGLIMGVRMGSGLLQQHATTHPSVLLVSSSSASSAQRLPAESTYTPCAVGRSSVIAVYLCAARPHSHIRFSSPNDPHLLFFFEAL